MQGSTARQAELRHLAASWQRGYLAAASTTPTEQCTRRAEHLLSELQLLGSAGRAAAVQAACELLRMSDPGGVSGAVFRLWHS